MSDIPPHAALKLLSAPAYGARFAFSRGDRHLGRMPAAISVIRVQPVRATRLLGVTVGDPRFSDGQTLRFRVLSRDPIAVRMVTDHPQPGAREGGPGVAGAARAGGGVVRPCGD
ncbi:MAG: hypothetical protein JOZ58_17730 [Acetobacteraceae bacterium]|nr:hypothetical protein [Acetobacteraceae bacterium]MBV8576864.1 hypothetical protein [Acetobacteraceae bacterium]